MLYFIALFVIALLLLVLIEAINQLIKTKEQVKMLTRERDYWYDNFCELRKEFYKYELDKKL